MASVHSPAALRLLPIERPSAVLVGRDAELARLRRSLASASVVGRVAFLLGEAGIGKSRLVAELRAGTGPGATTFLLGGCPAVVGLATPYAPLTAAFRTLLDERGKAWFRRLLGPDAALLGPILPSLADVPQVGEPPADLRARLGEAVHELLRLAGESQRVVLVLEDVHWASESTLAVLAMLLTDLPSGVLVIATAREEALPPAAARLVGEVSRTSTSDIVRLRPLSLEEVARQVTQIRGRTVPAIEAAAIHARSGGNPFLVEELLAAEGSGDGLASFRATLSLRLAELSDDARLLAATAAADAEPLGLDVLLEATGLDEARLDAALSACQVAGLLVAESASGTYRFRHALLQDAISESSTLLERRRAHRQLAAALAVRPSSEAGHAARAARHWLAAGEFAAALPLLLAAAGEASRGGGFVEALALLEEAHRVLPATPKAARRDITEAGLVCRIAVVLALDGRVDDSDRRFREAVGLAGDEEERLTAVAVRARWLWTIGREREAAPHRRELAEIGAQRGKRVRSLDLLSAMVRSMVGESRFREAEPLARLTARRARRAGRHDLEAAAAAALGLLEGFTGRHVEGTRHLQEAADLAAAHGHHEEFMLAAGNHLALLADTERRAEFARAVGHWRAVAERLHLRIMVAEVRSLWVDELVWLGRWAEAERWMSELDAAADLPPSIRLKLALSRAQLAIRRGQLAGADSALRVVLDLADIVQQAHHTQPVVYWQARRELDAGDAEAAATRIETGLDALSHAVEDGAWYELAALGMQIARQRASTDAGAARAAAARIVRSERRRRRRLSGLNPRQVKACLREIEADLATLQRRPSARPRSDAAAEWEALQNTATAAEAWLRAAEAHRAEGADAASRSATKRAIALAAQLGMRPLLERAAELLAPVDRRRRGAVSIGKGRSLTAREVEVVQLLSEGRTNREIAASLVIGEKTAATHVSNVLGKLGAARRTEAAVAAIRLGIVLDPDST